MEPLPGYTNWLRGTQDALACDVLPIDPCISLPWHYTPEQAMGGDAWECGAVWLHSAYACACACACTSHASRAEVLGDLRTALEVLRQDVGKAQYTLLVNPAGMPYDPRRLGGDHQIRAAKTGRVFTFSVRRTTDKVVLLAIDWGVIPG